VRASDPPGDGACWEATLARVPGVQPHSASVAPMVTELEGTHTGSVVDLTRSTPAWQPYTTGPQQRRPCHAGHQSVTTPAALSRPVGIPEACVSCSIGIESVPGRWLPLLDAVAVYIDLGAAGCKLQESRTPAQATPDTREIMIIRDLNDSVPASW
jgi:hypothetical protein